MHTTAYRPPPPPPEPARAPLGALIPAAEYVAERPMFRQGFDWYLRRHRTRLIRSGSLVLINRQKWIDEERFDATAREIAAEMYGVYELV